MSGAVRSTVSTDSIWPSKGSRRTVAVALSMRAMVWGAGAASVADDAFAETAGVRAVRCSSKGVLKPEGLSITRRSAVTVAPGIQRCQPSSRGCGHRQATDRSPSMAKCRPVASLTVSLSHGLARFQSIAATTTTSTTTSATSNPTAPKPHRAKRRAPQGLEGDGEPAGGGAVSKGRL